MTGYLALGVSILALATPAAAQEPIAHSLSTCWSCHGANGEPKDRTIPIIAGQGAAYVENQIRAYRSGERENQIMNSMATAIKREEIKPASAYVAQLPWPKIAVAAPMPAPAAIAACQGCHGADLMGTVTAEGGVAPRLAGQFQEYLAAQMTAFAQEARPNQETMTAVMKALDENERAQIAAYLASQ